MARDRSGGCDTGMPCYATKREAEVAGPATEATRCARCRQWHNDADKPSRRGRGGGERKGTVTHSTATGRKRQRPSRGQ